MGKGIFNCPIAHRGLHDRTAGVIENSRSAFEAAIEAGYAIECDIQLTRDGVQRLLVGPPDQEENWGTGFIPQAAIANRTRRMGVPNALDSVTVKHVSGGLSTLLLKSYDQGRTKWQANTVDGVWYDEEPPEDVYFEGITRTNATMGMVLVTPTKVSPSSRRTIWSPLTEKR